MRGLLSDRVFTGYMIAGSFAFAALFSYVSASPQTFSLLAGINSVGLIVVGQVNGRILVGRICRVHGAVRRREKDRRATG